MAPPEGSEPRKWQNVGNALNVIAMAAYKGNLYVVDKRQACWQMDLYGGDPKWLPFEQPLGSKLKTLTAYDGYVYGCAELAVDRWGCS